MPCPSTDSRSCTSKSSAPPTATPVSDEPDPTPTLADTAARGSDCANAVDAPTAIIVMKISDDANVLMMSSVRVAGLWLEATQTDCLCCCRGKSNATRCCPLGLSNLGTAALGRALSDAGDPATQHSAETNFRRPI